VWPWARELPEIWGFPFNISATAEATDFKFGTQLGFAKTHSHPEENVVWPWARGTPKYFGFRNNISATAGASDFKFGVLLGFAKSHHKSHPKEKVGIALG